MPEAQRRDLYRRFLEAGVGLGAGGGGPLGCDLDMLRGHLKRPKTHLGNRSEWGGKYWEESKEARTEGPELLEGLTDYFGESHQRPRLTRS